MKYHRAAQQKHFTPRQLVRPSIYAPRLRSVEPMTDFDCELCGDQDSTKSTLMAERLATQQVIGIAALLCVPCYMRACRHRLTQDEIQILRMRCR